MKPKKSAGAILVILIIGGLIGSLFSSGIGLVLPEGVVKKFLLWGIHDKGFLVENLDLFVLRITLGLRITLNIASILGFALSAYILRWYWLIY
jgi:hypothetical protein